MMETYEPKITLDIEQIAESGVNEILAALGEMEDESACAVRRSLRRLTAISVLSIGADSATLSQLQIERNAIIAGLLSVLEAKGVDAQHKIESLVIGLLYKAIDVVLGRLGL